MDLVTDDQRFAEMLLAMGEDPQIVNKFQELYRPVILASVECQKELSRLNLRGGLVIYRNQRVQVWPEAKFNAAPSSVRLVAG